MPENPGYPAGHNPQPYYAPPPPGFAPPATGQATTALILGIVSLVVCTPLGLVAIILGIMALSRAKRAPHLYGGKGQAIGGIVTGSVSLLVIPVLLVMILLPSLARARELSKRTVCNSNLRLIGTGLFIYANDDERARFPATLDALVTAGHLSPPNLQCPSQGNETNPSDYIYVPGLSSDRDPPTWIVAYEDPANHGGEGGHALYLDGHTEFLKADRLKAELQRCETERLAQRTRR